MVLPIMDGKFALGRHPRLCPAASQRTRRERRQMESHLLDSCVFWTDGSAPNRILFGQAVKQDGSVGDYRENCRGVPRSSFMRTVASTSRSASDTPRRTPSFVM